MREEQPMSLDSLLKTAYASFRSTRSTRPADPAEPSEFAAGHDAMAEALEQLATVLLYERDRTQAQTKAAAARAQTVRIRGDINRFDGTLIPLDHK